MHRAQAVADRIFAGIPSGAISSSALSAVNAVTLAASLSDDARDAIYSGVLSLAEAIQGLDRQLYSWTTVKLYYSVFYFARAALGLNGHAIIYRDRTPYAWTATAGQTPTKRSGTTHKVVLDAFKQYINGSILFSQQIGSEDPFGWLMARRESVNYKTPKFCEPSAPPYFKFIERHGVRRLLADYVSDESHLFTFDPDHAMLAFPIAGLKLLLSDLKTSGSMCLEHEDAIYLASQVFDKNGPLPEFRRMLLS
jgi:hypothetical protein